MNRVGNYKRKLDAAAITQIKALYREGWNAAQLGERFGVTRQAIYKALRRRGVAIRPRHPAGMPRVETNQRRDSAGAIVTLRSQTTGRLHSMHVPGKRIDALRAVAGWIDDAAGDWRLLSYSTPSTILGDLHGARLVSQRRPGEIDHLDCPEAQALGRIGRLDLLDPTLDNGWQSRAGRRA